MSKPISKRRQMREVVVQTLFQLIESPDYLTLDDAIAFAIEGGNYPEEGFVDVEVAEVKAIVEGIQAEQARIDQEISKYLNDWTLERLARIDLSILRLATYEILYLDKAQVPNKVAVNEAIELSKTFSDDKSKQFVSGVLGQFLADLD